MRFLRNTLLFTKNNLLKLRRKWISLPLLAMLPVITIGLIIMIIFSFFSQEEKQPIHVAIVDSDQSEETALIMDLIEQAEDLGNFINLKGMTKEDAAEGIKQNRISTYIELPENFTADLYSGRPVVLSITGNPEKAVESRLVKELLDSIARHIRASQANILTINHYAKALGIDDKTRNDLLFDNFRKFLLYTAGKDKVLNENEITNLSTASPGHYFGSAGWFVIVTGWLFIFYNFFYEAEQTSLVKRMRLYGVQPLQHIFARMIVTLLITGVLAFISFLPLSRLLEFDLASEQEWRAAGIMLLYSLMLLLMLAIIETVITSQKIRLLVQSAAVFVVVLLSGALVPTLYFPLKVQYILSYIYSAEAFYWLTEILLQERFYADFIPLLLINAAGLFMLVGIELGKERMRE